jgi:fermentation-respiration switch protein FrsA (DUF1100 family)
MACVRVAGIVALTAVVVLALSSVGVGLLLSAPARKKIGAPPPDLLVEPVVIPSASGNTLYGWFVPGQAGRGAVVLMHGVRDNRLTMVRRARMLSAAGFSVLLFDFQAHGESTGTCITFGHLESLDAASAVAFVKQRLPDEKIGVIGASLGGAAALLGPKPLPVDAMVLEAVYPDIGAATANRIGVVLGTTLGSVLGKPFARLLAFTMSPILGVTADALRPIDRMADIGVPLLVMSGTRDNRTPPNETTAMFDRAREPKALWLVKGAGHVDLEAYAPDQYRDRILPFLTKWLQRAP